MPRTNVIFKYKLDLKVGVQTLLMPGMTPVVRKVENMDGVSISLWAEVDPSRDLLQSDFKIVATGEEYNATAWKHVGTVLMGAYVWHVLQAVKLGV